MASKVVQTALLLLLIVHVDRPVALAADETIFRCNDELIVRVENLDRLRQTHSRLDATIRLAGKSGERVFQFNLQDPLVTEAIVIDLTGYGPCQSVSLDIGDGRGHNVYSRHVAPVPSLSIPIKLTMLRDKFSFVEPGSQTKHGEAPRIAMPDLAALRAERLVSPKRTVTTTAITYPVVTDSDLPGLASQNYVVVSRQSFAPDDAAKRSLYFSYRKAIFDPQTVRLKKWRKMLVEVPLRQEWLASSGDQLVNLTLDDFALHTSEELERFGNRWNAPQGYPMLGETSTGLAQGGQCVDTDELGRIYISNVHDGAGLVRFNPHTGKFEQPPVNFPEECRKLLPAEDNWRRNWDLELAHVVCRGDRVYVVFARNYRVDTPNGKFECCSGVVSIPQEHWNDTDAFRADIRLHAGCWSGARHRLYDENVATGGTRNLGTPFATSLGIAFGSWRLDLDEQGNSRRLATVKNLTDSAASDGTPLPPASRSLVQGLSKQQTINVGSAGRQFLKFAYGEFEIAKAALALTLPGAAEDQLVDTSGRYRSTFPGAPAGHLTVRFNIAAKIQAEPARYGEVSAALSGYSQGPSYCVTAIPGEADRALGVCEYSYYLSKLDFSRRETERAVFKTYLPLLSAGQPTKLPLPVGLGPYFAEWFAHDGALWLYLGGYTGMTRVKYSVGGEPLDAYTSDVFHTRLSPHPVDGTPRDNVKDFVRFLPAMNGRLIDIGRGRFARGGGAYSAGLELFDPAQLGPSQTAVAMNRCFGLHTAVTRLVHSAASSVPRQEIYVASGNIRPEYVEDIADLALRPQNQDPKIFVYAVDSSANLRDRYGFALPKLPLNADSSCSIVFSPCGQYLVMLQGGGTLLTYHLGERRFVDGVHLRRPDGQPAQPIEFSRPSATLWTAPNGGIFFLTALAGTSAESVEFFEVVVSTLGQISIRPHLAVTGAGKVRYQEFDGVVRCFLPDLVRRDGSYDFVLGGSQENGGQPLVRVIDDFVPPGGGSMP